MKSLHWVTLFLCLIAGLPSTLNAKNFVCSSGCKGASLVDAGGGSSIDSEFNNQLKFAVSNSGWGNGTGGATLGPAQMDNFGWLLSASNNPFVTVYTPNQSEREGHYVLAWTGAGQINLGSLATGTVNNVSCIGSFSVGCNNTSCNTGTLMQGYIVGGMLHVTTAPPGGAGCALAVYQPISNNSAIVSGTYNSATGAVSLAISNDIGIGPGVNVIVTGQGAGAAGFIEYLNGNFTTTAGTGGTTINFTAPTGLGSLSITATGQVASIAVNQWGTPTTIIGMSGSADCPSCTGTGGIGTYLLNYPQTIASSGSPINISPGVRAEFSMTGDYGSPPLFPSQSEWKIQEVVTTAGNPVQWIGFYHINDEANYAAGALVQSNYIAQMDAVGYSVNRDLASGNNQGNTVCALWSDRKPTQYYAYEESEFRPTMWAGTATYSLDANNYNDYAVTFNNGALFDKETVIFQVPAGDSTVTTTSGIVTGFAGSGGLGTIVPGSGYTDGYYPHVPLIYVTSGAGTGAEADIVVKGGIVTLAWLKQSGKGYTSGDSLTVSTSIIGSGTGFSVPVSSISNGVYNVQLSIDGGATYLPLLNRNGSQVSNSGQIPLQNAFVTAKYDATFHAWLYDATAAGLNCRWPPEVEIAVDAAANQDPWMIEQWMGTDPITDWSLQEAYYVKTNYPSLHPWFEIPNEDWNANQAAYGFLLNRAELYQGMDPTAWTSANGTLTDRETGKIASLLGQEISAVYGDDTSKYEMTVGIQTPNGFNANQNNERLLSNSWVNQTSTLIPVQPNFTSPVTVNFAQQPAWMTTTRVAGTSYWQPNESSWYFAVGAPQEVRDAYNWVNGSASTRNTIMASYMATAQAGVAWLNAWYVNWQAWAVGCAGAATAPTCPIKSIDQYEGGNSTGSGLQINGSGVAVDDFAIVNGYTANTTCTLTLQPTNINPSSGATNTIKGTITSSVFTAQGSTFGLNIGALLIGPSINTTITGYDGADDTQDSFNIAAGQSNVGLTTLTGVYDTMAVQGMPITLTSISETGGTAWATLAAAGNLTVGSPAAIPQQNLTIYQNGSPIDCSSGYDTLNKATVTYVGSGNWVNTLRTYSYYWSGLYPQIQQAIWQEFKTAGGINPAQSNFAGTLPWGICFQDSFCYFSLAACTSCTITNGSGSVGNILTLGGTVTGEFQIGQTLWGKCVTSPASSQNPATAQTTITALLTGTGHSSGDTLQVSQNSTCTTAGTVTGTNANTIPSYNYEKAFNHGAGWLLKRDLDPANNDNSPAFLDKAA